MFIQINKKHPQFRAHDMDRHIDFKRFIYVLVRKNITTIVPDGRFHMSTERVVHVLD